jgi:hypothetical protein
MKHVTFTAHSNSGRAGERRLVPDVVAERLERNGEIEPNPPDWPEKPAAREPNPQPEKITKPFKPPRTK